ncbi:hypothetical protein [Kitasatospora sp. KL5]|uniref:hypothetical protein n=1 Tax=Kitasatospora sp. KL5 TaxID=3425125 RepID=UPI003D6E02C4
MLRSAGLDWFEQGDVWYRVERLRPLPPEVEAGRVDGMRGRAESAHVRNHRTELTPSRASGGLASFAPWFEAFDRAGAAIGDAACRGALSRGPRSVLAHHVISHANRIGLSAVTQATPARVAREAAMGE